MEIELLVTPDCPHAPTAADLIKTAVADTRIRATISQTTINSEEQARNRAFTGSPTILLNGVDPFARPDAPVGLVCRLYLTSDGPRGVPGIRELRQAMKEAAAHQSGLRKRG
jgi:hypothetical protein